MTNGIQKDSSPQHQLLLKGASELSPQDACQFLHSQLAVQPSEVFLALCFDVEQHLICIEEMFYASPEGTLVCQGEQLINDAVVWALQHKATEVTIMHHSPGGNGCPMPVDIAIGQLLLEALDAVEVRLLDYLTMGKSGSISLFEKGFLV